MADFGKPNAAGGMSCSRWSKSGHDRGGGGSMGRGKERSGPEGEEELGRAGGGVAAVVWLLD